MHYLETYVRPNSCETSTVFMYKNNPLKQSPSEERCRDLNAGKCLNLTRLHFTTVPVITLTVCPVHTARRPKARGSSAWPCNDKGQLGVNHESYFQPLKHAPGQIAGTKRWLKRSLSTSTVQIMFLIQAVWIPVVNLYFISYIWVDYLYWSRCITLVWKTSLIIKRQMRCSRQHLLILLDCCGFSLYGQLPTLTS